MKTLLKLSVLVAISVALSFNAYASDWTGGNGNWGDDTNPGWNGTGVPNAVGAVANFPDATTTGNFVTNVDIPATVGTINYNANGDASRSIIAVNDLTLDQDGAGPGFVTISNTNPSASTNNFLVVSNGQFGNLVLADDLLVTNTGASTAPGNAILLGTFTGTGNVTFSTVGNTVTNQVIAPGSIRINQNSTYVGNVLIQKGAVMTNAFQAFGDPSNMVTLGQAGQGDVTMMGTTNNVDISNPFTVAAGTGGTTVLGSLNSQGSTFSGNITLNGNLTINSWVTQTASPGALVLTGTISGPGSLTFTSTTINANPTTVLSELDTFDSVTGNPNSFTGGTFVNVGTLIAKGNGACGAGNVSLTAPNVQLTLTSNGTSKIADTAALSVFDSTDKLNLNFASNRNEKVAVFKIAGVAQPVGVYNSTNLPAIITGTGQIQVLVGDVKITSVAHSAGHALVAGLTAPNVTVTVHASNDLTGGFDSGVQVTADAFGVFNYDDATGLTKRFYLASYP